MAYIKQIKPSTPLVAEILPLAISAALFSFLSAQRLQHQFIITRGLMQGPTPVACPRSRIWHKRSYAGDEESSAFTTQKANSQYECIFNCVYKLLAIKS